MTSKLIFKNSVAAILLTLSAMTSISRGSVTVYENSDAGTNFVPDTNDGTPGRPTGNFMGNTITLTATQSLLTSATVKIATLDPNIASQNVTLSLYQNDGAADPGLSGLLQPGTLIGSQTVSNVSLLGGVAPVTFSFPSLLVPGTFTFIIGLTPGSTSASSLAGLKTTATAPQTGSAVNTLWFGTGVAGAWTSSSTWAIADGATTNHVDAVFVAEPVPEPSIGFTSRWEAGLCCYSISAADGRGMLTISARHRIQQAVERLVRGWQMMFAR